MKAYQITISFGIKAETIDEALDAAVKVFFIGDPQKDSSKFDFENDQRTVYVDDVHELTQTNPNRIIDSTLKFKALFLTSKEYRDE